MRARRARALRGGRRRAAAGRCSSTSMLVTTSNAASGNGSSSPPATTSAGGSTLSAVTRHPGRTAASSPGRPPTSSTVPGVPTSRRRSYGAPTCPVARRDAEKSSARESVSCASGGHGTCRTGAMRFLFATIQSFESEFYGTVGAELAPARPPGLASDRLAPLVPQRCAIVGSSRSACRTSSPRSLLSTCDAERTRIEEQVRPAVHQGRIPDRFGLRRACGGLVRAADGAALPRPRTPLRSGAARRRGAGGRDRAGAHGRPPRRARRGDSDALPLLHDLPAPAQAVRGHARTRRSSPPDAVRPLEPDERREVEAFIRDFTSTRTPIRAAPARSRDAPPVRSGARVRGARLGPDRDNEYLRPGRWAGEHVSAWAARWRPARCTARRAREGRTSTSRCTSRTTTRSSA